MIFEAQGHGVLCVAVAKVHDSAEMFIGADSPGALLVLLVDTYGGAWAEREMAFCRDCRFTSENLMMYSVSALTVAIGVRVRVPESAQAPVSPKRMAPGPLIITLPDLFVDPVIPLSTIAVVLTVPWRQVVYSGTLLTRVTVSSFRSHGFEFV